MQKQEQEIPASSAALARGEGKSYDALVPAPSQPPGKSRPSNGLRRNKPAPHSAVGKRDGFLSEAQAVAAVADYLRRHPRTVGISVSVHREKIVVKSAAPALKRSKRRVVPIAPRGYFAPFYTAEDAAQDNRFAAQSVPFDPADFQV